MGGEEERGWKCVHGPKTGVLCRKRGDGRYTRTRCEQPFGWRRRRARVRCMLTCGHPSGRTAPSRPRMTCTCVRVTCVLCVRVGKARAHIHHTSQPQIDPCISAVGWEESMNGREREGGKLLTTHESMASLMASMSAVLSSSSKISSSFSTRSLNVMAMVVTQASLFCGSLALHEAEEKNQPIGEQF